MVVCEGDRIVVIGVSSYGHNLDHPDNHTCEKERTVGVYADIQAHLSWIMEKIGEGFASVPIHETRAGYLNKKTCIEDKSSFIAAIGEKEKNLKKA